jgi:hypothetical protein
MKASKKSFLRWRRGSHERMDVSMKFEDLVAALEKTRSSWELAQIPLDAMKDGMADLRDRLQALEDKKAADHAN